MKQKNGLMTHNTRLNIRGRLRRHYVHANNLKILEDVQLPAIKKDLK